MRAVTVSGILILLLPGHTNPQVKMDQPTAPQLSLGMKPTVSSTATRAQLFASIRSHVFGPNHERLSSLAKLHILASNPSFNSDIFGRMRENRLRLTALDTSEIS